MFCPFNFIVYIYDVSFNSKQSVRERERERERERTRENEREKEKKGGRKGEIE